MSIPDRRRSVIELERWAAPGSSLSIEYAASAIREIADSARDHWAASPGTDAAGVLFGSQAGNLVTIAAWRPLNLPAYDPSLLAEFVSSAKDDPGVSGLQAVGWFVSRERARVRPSLADLKAFNHIYPKDWRALLGVEPLRDGATLAAFYARGDDGLIQADHHPVPLRLEATPFAPRPSHPVPLARAVGQSPPQVLPGPDRRKWIWAAPAILTLAVITMLLHKPAGSPPSLAFQARDDGRELHLTWDKSSEPVLKASRGLLKINDGPKTEEFPLDREQLQRGDFSYARKSGDLELLLTVYRADKPEITESARFVGQPPGTTNSEDPATVRRQRDALLEENDRLRKSLQKETAKRQQMQEAVRILENRLEVAPRGR